MNRRIHIAFSLLLLVQAGHSLEEFLFRLFDALAPARFVSGLFGIAPALGFALANSLLVGFGLWCLAVPIGRGWPSAPLFVRGWALVEMANGCAHLALAWAAGGYFPGLYTAPLLLAAAWWLMRAAVAGRGGGGAIPPGNL